MIATFGEILLRLSTRQQKRITQTDSFDAVYGGSETNVAVSLSNFGNRVTHISRLPQNELSEAIMQMLSKYRVDTSNLIFGGNRLGLYFLEMGAGPRGANVTYDRAGSAISEIKPGMIDWDRAFENVKWFHFSGITPAISQSAAEVCLEGIEKAAQKEITISVDLNYRSKLWQYGKKPNEIMPELLKHCDVIFGGIDAPEKMLGIVPEDKNSTQGELLETDMMSIGDQMLKKFPKAKYFSTTLRWIKSADHHQLQGMIYTKKGRELYLSSTYDMPKMVDRIGGGDAFMAGLIHGLIHFNEDFQRIVDFASAASVLKHYIHGDFNLSSMEEIENLVKGHGNTISR